MAELTDAEIEAALARGAAARFSEPRAAAARYDRHLDRVVVDLANGCTFAFPPRLAQGLEDATEDQRAITEANAGIYAFDVTHLRAVLPAITDLKAKRVSLARRVLVIDNDRFDHHFGLKLDLFERLGIGWVGQRNHQPIAALGKCNHPLALHQLGVDRLFRQVCQLECREVQQRVAECV